MATPDSTNINKVAALAGMFLLFAIYVYLNVDKFHYTASFYRDLLGGEPAPELAIRADGETLTRFKLASTGIFDASGKNQINFQRLDEVTFGELHEAMENLVVYLNGSRTEFQKHGRDSFMVLLLPGRKIYLVKDNDIKTIAALLWNEKRRIKDVLRCQGETLCRNLRLAWGGGVGPLQGPYLETDIIPQRSGMPRGRWGLGPGSIFFIDASRPVAAVIRLTVLDPHQDQQIIVQGSSVKGVHRVQAKDAYLNISGKRLYPKKYVVDVMLAQGRNEIRIEYGSWQARKDNTQGKMSAYLVGVVLAAR